MSFEGSIYKKPVAEQVPKGFGEIDLDGNFGTDNLPVPIEGDMPVIQEMANEGEVFGNVIETPVNDSVEAANDQYYEVNNNDIEDVEWREASEDSIETEVVSSENESLEGLNEDKKNWSHYVGEKIGKASSHISKFVEGWRSGIDDSSKESFRNDFRSVYEYRIGPTYEELEADRIYRMLLRGYPVLDSDILSGSHYDIVESDPFDEFMTLRKALYASYGSTRGLESFMLQAGIIDPSPDSRKSAELISANGEEPPSKPPLEGEYIPNGSPEGGVSGNEVLQITQQKEVLALEDKSKLLPSQIATEVANGTEIGVAYQEGVKALTDRSAENPIAPVT